MLVRIPKRDFTVKESLDTKELHLHRQQTVLIMTTIAGRRGHGDDAILTGTRRSIHSSASSSSSSWVLPALACKLSIRLLPPLLTETSFRRQLNAYLDGDLQVGLKELYFVGGSLPVNSYEAPIYSTAYILFTKESLLQRFLEQVQGKQFYESQDEEEPEAYVPSLMRCINSKFPHKPESLTKIEQYLSTESQEEDVFDRVHKLTAYKRFVDYLNEEVSSYSLVKPKVVKTKMKEPKKGDGRQQKSSNGKKRRKRKKKATKEKSKDTTTTELAESKDGKKKRQRKRKKKTKADTEATGTPSVEVSATSEKASATSTDGETKKRRRRRRNKPSNDLKEQSTNNSEHQTQQQQQKKKVPIFVKDQAKDKKDTKDKKDNDDKGPAKRKNRRRNRSKKEDSGGSSKKSSSSNEKKSIKDKT